MKITTKRQQVQYLLTFFFNNIYGDANRKDKLTTYNGKNITYDAIGNPLSYDIWNYTWDNGRQLSTATSTGGKNISYKYNSAGIRTSQTVNGVTTSYHLSGDKVTYEDNGTDKIYYTYDSNGNLVSFSLNGVEYYYIKNAQGDIIGIFDKTGTQVVSYTYDTWGKLISIKDQNGTDVTNVTTHIGYKNPYRYRGYRYDTETGLYYLNARYYNSEWGRFVNADALTGVKGELLSHNKFAYCGNNPVYNKDCTGYLYEQIVASGFGAIIGGLSYGASKVLSHQSINNRELAISMLSGAISGAVNPYATTKVAVGLLSGGISAATDYANQKSGGGDVNYSEVIVNFGLGAGFGASLFRPGATTFANKILITAGSLSGYINKIVPDLSTTGNFTNFSSSTTQGYISNEAFPPKANSDWCGGFDNVDFGLG